MRPGSGGRGDTLTWPVVGRDDELALVDDLLGPRDSAGVVIAGSAGVGKTRLLDEALVRASGRGLRTMRAVATAAARSIPFGALSHLLPDTLSSQAGLRNLIGVAASAIAGTEEDATTTPLLAVDDAHNLDDHSAALLHHLALSRRARVALTVRTGEPVPDAVTSLWKDSLCERIELQPLSSSEVGDLLVLVLGGMVDEGAVQRAATASGGNALYLRELVLGAIDSGALVRTGDVWRWKGALALTTRLSELIETRLASLTETERRALEIASTADVLESRLFEDIVGADVAESLERQGLLQSWTGERRAFVRVCHPLYGEAIRATTPEVRLRTIYTELSDAIQAAGARRRGDLLRIATWSVDAAVAADPQMLVAAAQRAIAMLDPVLGERLVRAAVQSGGGFGAEMLLGQAIWMQGRPDDAEREFARIAADAPDEMTRAIATGTRAQVLFWALGRHDATVDLMTELELGMSEGELRDEVTANRAYFLFYAGRVREGRELAEALNDRPSLPPRTRVLALAPLIWSLIEAGRPSEALELMRVRREDVIAGTLHLPWAGIVQSGPKLFAAANTGDVAGIEVEMNRLNDEALEREADWLRGYALVGYGWASVLRGDVCTAATHLHQALPLVGEVEVGGGKELATGLLAQALGMQGDADGAGEVLQRVPLPVSLTMGGLMQEGRVWAAAARGEVSSAIAIALDVASSPTSEESVVSSLWLLHAAARVGGASDVAARVERSAGSVEGPRAAATAQHVAALARGDAAALDGAAASFADLGFLLVAAEAATEAARIYAKGGLRASAQASRERAAAFAARCAGARTPFLLELSDSPLSPREREIATLAARGLSNADIADRLVLSVRTVENHLRAVFAKLGVSSRRELGAILGDAAT